MTTKINAAITVSHCSQVSLEPFKSSPLVHGYCGMLQYILWKREHQQTHTPIKPESDDDSESENGVKQSMKAQAYCRQALAHFDTLRLLPIAEKDCVNAFTVLHYKVIMTDVVH